jgi:FkbM family methyltransferase
MIKRIQKKIMELFNIDYPLPLFEVLRLRKMERYIAGKSKLFGRAIDFVDACSFLEGLKEIFVLRNYDFICKKDNPLIIDCGSNIGLSIIFFKMIYPNCRIIGFEPDANIFRVLRKNMESFGFMDVELHNNPLWINDGNVDFMLEGGFSGRIKKNTDVENIKKVPALRLKKLLNQRVDFLKLDVEGSENAIIEDCSQELNNIENMFIEYHSHFSEEQVLDNILNILKLSGFRYQMKDTFTSKNPFIDRPRMMGMDFQIDIFAYRET